VPTSRPARRSGGGCGRQCVREELPASRNSRTSRLPLARNISGRGSSVDPLSAPVNGKAGHDVGRGVG
jgi:hypothetical protein